MELSKQEKRLGREEKVLKGATAQKGGKLQPWELLLLLPVCGIEQH